MRYMFIFSTVWHQYALKTYNVLPKLIYYFVAASATLLLYDMILTASQEVL